MTPPSGAAPGERAPDFVLPDTAGTPVRLADLRGGPVLVVFFPFAFSAVCGAELGAVRDAGDELADATVLAVSTDPMFSLRAWAAADRIPFPLLSDFWPHGAVARRYGAFDEASGHARRVTVLLDGAGVVRWRVESPAGRPRDVAAYRAALAALAEGADPLG